MKNEFKAPHVVNLSIPDKEVLYATYMPWLKKGGLFFTTRNTHQLNDAVLLSLDLLGGAEKVTVSGQVVWITPRGSSGKRSAGIGVQFTGNEGGDIQGRIESMLAGSDSRRRTHTM